jgi:hypothetical protein
MPTICGYTLGDDALTIVIPVSDGLIRDACDREAVAKMASELASKTAHDAVIARRIEHEGEN